MNGSLQGGRRQEALHGSPGRMFSLFLDEVQKIPAWSDSVKKLYDEDRRFKNKVRVVVLGSSALLMQRGLTESLAGRFEIQRHGHWSYPECKEYFSLNLEEYLYFGGYPGSLSLRGDEERWARYIRDSLIETVLSKDILLMMPVSKPALLRQVFGLAMSNPAQILSYQKMLGQLQDAGNTTTIASYIRLLSGAFLVTSIERYSGSKIRQKGSIPKLLVFDNALISAMSGRKFKELLNDKPFWGRMVENAVGAVLYGILQEKGGNLFYWRERHDEVDFVVHSGGKLIAIEVKSGVSKNCEDRMTPFLKKYKTANAVIISPSMEFGKRENIKNLTLHQFFSNPQMMFEL